MTTDAPTDEFSSEEIERGVVSAIAEALALPDDDVSPEHYLMDDLGAGSLDFLDLVFKLEHTFDIQITRGEMERAARGDMTEEEFAPEGVISEAGLERLRELMPEADDRIEAGLRPTQILELFKVRTFINIIDGKLSGVSA
jgi:acyl carrier protein